MKARHIKGDKVIIFGGEYSQRMSIPNDKSSEQCHDLVIYMRFEKPLGFDLCFKSNTMGLELSIHSHQMT